MSGVVVVGAGWAGLAAAVELSCHDIPVTVLEAAPQLGGRARRLVVAGRQLDNGQHLLVGAYHALLELLERLGRCEGRHWQRLPLSLELRAPAGPALRLDPPSWPAPWHLAAALLRAPGLSLGQRLQVLRAARALLEYGACAATVQDQPLQAFLEGRAQGPGAIRRLWEPLCLAMLNTPIHQASTVVFARVLHDLFTRHRGDSDLLIPKQDLGALFPLPAAAFVRRHGGRILTGRRVSSLEIRKGRVVAARTRKERFPLQGLVLALPPEATRRLLVPHPEAAGLAGMLARLQAAPICTVYLRYPQEITLGRPLLGLLDTTTQWLFDRGYDGHPGIMAAVISGPGPHMRWSRATLARTVGEELARFFPRWPAPQVLQVVRERRATFLCHAGVAALRPQGDGPWPNCRLAGDHLDTGYPATLEGAVRSGLAAARALMQFL